VVSRHHSGGVIFFGYVCALIALYRIDANNFNSYTGAFMHEDNNTPKATMSEKITSLYQPQRMLRIKIMLELLGCSRTTLYRWVNDGKFPQPKMNGGRTLGWTYSQYEQWLTEH
jgi:Predicted transcriptional regulator